MWSFHIKFMTHSFDNFYDLDFHMTILLAHLSRRLIGELVVYEGVRPSVRRLSTFSNDISSEAVRPILFMFHI